MRASAKSASAMSPPGISRSIEGSSQVGPPGPGAYFCTATVQAGATKRSKATMAELNGLHIDIDFKSIAIGAEETERELRRLILLPSKVVASGGGLHAYWLFRKLAGHAGKHRARRRRCSCSPTISAAIRLAPKPAG